MAPSGWPTLVYVPVEALDGRPHVVVDGAPRAGTVLTLSHWPGTPTPERLWSDVSVGIVRTALTGPRLLADGVDVATIDHYDADGVMALALLCVEGLAAAHGPILEAAAAVGDFDVVTDHRAAQVAFAVNALAGVDRSGRPRTPLDGGHREGFSGAVADALSLLPELAADPASYEMLWGAEARAYDAGVDALSDGSVCIEEHAEHDMAVVRVDGGSVVAASRWGGSPVHPAVVHSATGRSRIATLTEGRYELRYRYESWVRLVSRRPRLRVDLSAAADELTRAEGGGGRWVFDGAGAITGALHLAGDRGTTLAPEDFVDVVSRHLRALDAGPPAWDPYAVAVRSG